MLATFLFFIGFFILVRGANLLVDASSALARRIGISTWIVGVVIVGIGTSIPEFSVSFLANVSENPGISLGTVAGSNIFNILFILGIAAVISPLRMKTRWVRQDLVWNILAVAAVAIVGSISLFDGVRGISRWEGALLLVAFGVWLYYTIKAPEDTDIEENIAQIFAPSIAFLMIVAGFAGVIFGGKWVVDGAIMLAGGLGIGETIIGLVIVGVGTSLPELVVTVAAAYRKQPGIVVGSIIGSNIFDFLMILGVSALVKPVAFPTDVYIDEGITALAAAVLFAFVFIGKSHTLLRWQGAVLVLLYVLYVVGRCVGGC